MKTGVTVFVLTWMLVWMLVSVTLIVKVQSLQNQIDILTENTIRILKKTHLFTPFICIVLPEILL